ncbi:MAG: hypothetical protein ACOCRO_09915 [Halanaerobiales bacterium]
MKIIKVTGIIINAFKLIIILSGKFTMLLPKMLIWRKKGINSFQKELSNAGISNEVIKELSTEYKKMGKISNWINK